MRPFVFHPLWIYLLAAIISPSAFAVRRDAAQATSINHLAQVSSPSASDAPPVHAAEPGTDQLLQQGYEALYTGRLQQAIELFQQVIEHARQTGDRGGEAAALLGMAETQSWLGQIPDSLDTAQQALLIYQKLSDRQGEAEALHRIGDAQLDSGKLDDSTATLQQALTLRREVQDRQGEGWTLGILGISQLNHGDRPAGLAMMQQAITILREPVTAAAQLQQQYRQAVILAWIGNAQMPLDPQQAEDTLQAALTLTRSIGNQAVERLVQSQIGALAEQQQQPDAALHAYQEAARLASATGNRAAQANALYRVGEVYSRQTQYSQAIESYQQALAVYRSLNQQSDVGWILVRIGQSYSAQQNYPQAQDFAQQALSLFRSEHIPVGEAQSLISLGLVYTRQEQYPEALTAFQQAFTIYQTLDNQSAQANALLNMGYIYDQQKQYPEALNAYQQALNLVRTVKDADQEFTLLILIGYADLDQNQYTEARSAFQQALELAQQANDPTHAVQALSGIGSTYRSHAQQLRQNGADAEALAEIQQSAHPFQQAFVLLDSAQLPPELIQSVILNLEDVYVSQGHIFDIQHQYPQAIAAFQQGLTILQENQERLAAAQELRARSNILSVLASAYSNNGQYSAAVSTYEQAVQVAMQLNDTADQIQQLQFVASTYRRLGNFDKALEASQQAVKIAQEKLPDDQTGMINALITLAQSYDALGRYAEALETYQQALTIAKTTQDIQLQSSLLNNLGSVYASQGHYLQALQYHQQAQAIDQSVIQQLKTNMTAAFPQLCSFLSQEASAATQQRCLENAETRAVITLNNLGLVYGNLGRYADALAAYQQVLAVAQQYHLLEQQMITLNNLGTLYEAQGEYAKALEVLQQSLQIAVDTGSRARQAGTLNNIAQVYNDQGQYPKALDYYQQSLALVRAIQSLEGEAIALNNIGQLYSDLGNYSEGLNFLQQSSELSQKVGISNSVDLGNIANIYTAQGRYAEALETLQQALTLAQASGDQAQESLVLRNMAAVYESQANYAKALEVQQQALAIQQEIGARPREIGSLIQLGRLYHDLGDYPKALEFHQQALNLSREIGSRLSQMLAIANIGRAYLYQQQYDKALEAYQQSLSIAREIGDVDSESNYLFSIGRTYEKQGQSDQAVDYEQQALALARQTGVRPLEGFVLNSLGTAYANQGKFPQALSTLQQALSIHQQIQAPAAEAEALATIGKTLAADHQPELAIVFYKQSVNVTESIRQGLHSLTTEQQQSYTNTVAETYRQLADLLLQQNRVLEAQQVLELLKVQELEDYLKNVRGNATTEQGVVVLRPEAEILQKFNEQQKTAEQLGQELLQLQQISENQRTPAQQQRLVELVQLQTSLEQQFINFSNSSEVQQWLAQLSPSALRQTVDLTTLSGMRDILQQRNAVLLYPLVLDDRLELVITTPNSPPLRRTVHVSRQELNQAIAEFRQALTHPDSDAKTPAQKLYQWLIQPIEADLKNANATTIVYSPDGQLRYIPLAALYDGHQWLVERYQINNITEQSLTKFAITPQTQPHVLAGVFADTTLSYPVPNVPEPLHGLASAGREVDQITVLLPNTTSLVDRAFTPEAIQTRPSAYNILHFATHAAFVPRFPDQSFILFGNGTPLTLLQIQAWTFSNIDLVVLSACETGVGGLGNGEEIPGLGYVFQTKGAKAVIASLWSVDDGGTQILMDAFYTALKQGYSKTEALQRAQQALITNSLAPVGDSRGGTIEVVSRETGLPPEVTSHLSHPYYWAPFILIGNGL